MRIKIQNTPRLIIIVEAHTFAAGSVSLRKILPQRRRTGYLGIGILLYYLVYKILYKCVMYIIKWERFIYIFTLIFECVQPPVYYNIPVYIHIRLLRYVFMYIVLYLNAIM